MRCMDQSRRALTPGRARSPNPDDGALKRMRMKSIHGWLLAIALVAPGAGAAPQRLEFNRDIRPILSENCFVCHGTDKHNGNLRLDLAAAATQPTKSGEVAIVPGKPDASEMVKRILSTD